MLCQGSGPYIQNAARCASKTLFVKLPLFASVEHEYTPLDILVHDATCYRVRTEDLAAQPAAAIGILIVFILYGNRMGYSCLYWRKMKISEAMMAPLYSV